MTKTKLAKPGRQTVPISKRALVARINRKLAASDEKIAVWRHKDISNQNGHMCTGDYYRVMMSANGMIEYDVDIEALGRELGTLHPWESLAEQRK